MKTIIITSALILGSLIQVAAQQSRPGQPIGGILVKGAKTESAEAKVAGNPIGGIIVKGAKTESPEAKVAGGPIGGIIVKGAKTESATTTSGENPLFEADSKSPLKTAGQPIGGIVVKGGKSATIPTFSRVTDSKGTIELNIPQDGNYTFFLAGPIKGLIKTRRTDGQKIATYTVNDDGSVVLTDLKAGAYQFTVEVAAQNVGNSPLYTPASNEHVNPLFQN